MFLGEGTLQIVYLVLFGLQIVADAGIIFFITFQLFFENGVFLVHFVDESFNLDDLMVDLTQS